jgi:hypothetical protein
MKQPFNFWTSNIYILALVYLVPVTQKKYLKYFVGKKGYGVQISLRTTGLDNFLRTIAIIHLLLKLILFNDKEFKNQTFRCYYVKHKKKVTL